MRAGSWHLEMQKCGFICPRCTYRERFANPWDMAKLEVETTSASGDVRTTVFDALARPVLTSVRGMDGWPKVMSQSYDVLGRPWETSNWGAGAPAPEKTVQRYL
jgi:hypothetical protein